MVNLIAQIFGFGLVTLILICLVWTVGNYIIEDIKLKRNRR
tara:strand:+ start:324 stop:446 length:123 start_codon:yes stop_codon:yes gene_type:complete